jgi:hypothetical protein
MSIIELSAPLCEQRFIRLKQVALACPVIEACESFAETKVFHIFSSTLHRVENTLCGHLSAMHLLEIPSLHVCKNVPNVSAIRVPGRDAWL